MMVGPFQKSAFQPFPAFQQERSAPAEFSGGFLHAFEAFEAQRAAKRRKRKKLEDESEAIQHELDRQIAQLLREQEARDEAREEHERLTRLVQEFGTQAQELSDRTKIAYVRALVQQNFSAIEALDRELQRQLQDEEVAVLMMLLNED